MDLSIRSGAGTTGPATPPSRAADTAAPATREPGAAEAWRAAEPGSGIAAVAAPKPLRFPWLSRLSAELGPAAKQKPAFASAQVLGDHLDRSV